MLGESRQTNLKVNVPESGAHSVFADSSPKCPRRRRGRPEPPCPGLTSAVERQELGDRVSRGQRAATQLEKDIRGRGGRRKPGGAAKRGGAGTSPRGQFHVPPLPCCPSHPGTRRETAASLGTEMWPNSHTGRGSGMGTRDGREKRPRPSSGKPGPARGCSPSPRRGRRGGRCQEHFQTHTARVPPKYR